MQQRCSGSNNEEALVTLSHRDDDMTWQCDVVGTSNSKYQ